jgi:DNA repair exonuclease SbcCD ATPase subunit
MKRKFLEDMGLTKEQVDSIMSENGNDIEGAKGNLEQVKTELSQTKAQLTERDTQLEELKKSSGDNADLKNQIETLQEENEKVKQEKESEIKELKLSVAIKQALGDTVQDSDLVTGLLDRSKLILGDDEKVTGLDEQIKTIKESKPFLFKEEKQEPPKPGFRPIGAPGSHEETKLETKGGTVDMKAAIAAKLQSQLPTN